MSDDLHPERKPAGTTLWAGMTVLATVLAPFANAQATEIKTPHEPVPVGADRRLPTYTAAAGLSGVLRIAKSEAMATLMTYWAEDFHKLYPELTFSTVATGASSPGVALANGSVDLGPLARELPLEERQSFVTKFGYEPFAVRVAGGSYRTLDKALAIAFLVNSRNPISRLTLPQIDAIYSKHRLRGYKEVDTWGDVGATGEWRDKPIHIWGLVRPNEPSHIPVSGNISQFISERAMNGGEYRDDISERTTLGSHLSAFEAIALGIASDPYAIGYGGFGNVVAGVKSVALAEDASGPFYSGTLDEVASQKYPLSRVIYIYVNKVPGHPLVPAIREFLKFILSKQGQQDVEKEGIFLPLPFPMATEELAKIL